MVVSTQLIQSKYQPPAVLVCGAFAGAAEPAVFTPTTADATLVAGQSLALDASGGPLVMTLPAAVDCDRVAFEFTDITNVITFTPDGTDLVGGVGGARLATAAISSLATGDRVVFKYDAATSDWQITKL